MSYRLTAGVAGLAVALVLAGCGGDDEEADASAPLASAAAPGSATYLADVCPSTVVVQTDWNPESEHGGTYELVGPNPSIDADKKRVTGTLVAHGGVDTGVRIEIRAGGPAIGFQQVSAQMYADPSITLGYNASDEAIALSKTQPTIGVFAGLEKSPQIIMWSPDKHPDWRSIADIGKTDTKVLYFQGAVYMDYLTGNGTLKKSQVDGSYDGAPANFVASGGEFAQQGFATAEPYIYENEVTAWKKKVTYQLIADAGFDFYQNMLGVRAGDLQKLTPCLKKLVPILQQSYVDFLGAPDETNALILKLVEEYNNGWTYTKGVADYSVRTMKELGIVGNGKDSAIGNFDDARVQHLIEITGPIFTAQNKEMKAGLKPSDIVTNEFIDPSIGLK
ncbi:ABC transporter substrate-binding protein [Phytohabitans rumicis]|uniref:Nitrate ABC transporter substrate-binding protein n=1 Tax=Phytohabitans rumicis TaxID=1076125 RepID=A0A6V8KPT7_9ACTN|nr:ABC transporter substrate-binding protein [Phytohabitans rumicis]GFJ87193.1 nitrate ABC transporter substrate-binding protein [Phytohabitans rumicis]